MSGGDMHVRVHASYGQIAVNSVIDANTRPAGDMTTPVSVGDRTLYMTNDGAGRYNTLKDNSYGTLRFSAHDDTRSERHGFLWLFTRQVSNIPRGHTEGHIGNPDD